MADTGAVEITLKDVYDAVGDLAKEVAALQTTIAVRDEADSAVKKKVDDHESRLRLVERRVWTAIGMALALPTIFQLVQLKG